MNPSLRNRLEYPRQFILGPYPVAEFAHWKTSFVGPHLVLQVHEDLPLVQVEHAGLRLTLLGFVLDPLAPEHDDETILRELAERCSDAQAAPRRASELSGRWVMIADDGTNLVLFHDPCGLREVYHTGWDGPETWCASQPERIRGVAKAGIGSAQREYLDSGRFDEHAEPWFPSPTSPYAGIRHLTPNHCLDLRTREVRRYWPHKPLRHLEPAEGAHLAAQLLRQTVRAAALRFPLAAPLSAGMDTRTILAATRGIEDVWHYTAVRGDLDLACADVEVARRVLDRVGRRQQVVHCPRQMDAEFAAFYLRNTSLASPAVGAITEGLWRQIPAGRVHLSNQCSEIVRDTFGITHEPEPDAESLATLMGLRGEPFVTDHIDIWLEKTRPVAAHTGFRLWDLFFMEQEHGVWAANGQSQSDVAHERVTPFNHRGLLASLMGVDPEFRQPPDFDVHRRMMQILWPDVLAEPFHAPGRSLRARSLRVYRKLREKGQSSDVARTISAGVRRLMTS